MMDSRDQGLVERIESLEEEVEEQRLLLRYALGRFDDAETGLTAEDTVEEKTTIQSTGSVQKGDARKTLDTSPWPTMAQPRSISPTRQKSADEPVGEKDEPNGSSTLAELFRLRGWEWWLNKVGIGLLLFGVVFLFKFSVDQGWLMPEVRIGFGLALGTALVWLGLRTYGERRAFSQVMLGGGIATFYITGFAAFQLYALVPYALAFVFLVAVTLLAFAISIRQDEAALSVIGAAGGFGTPFLLYDGSGDMGGLVLYTILILAGISSVYLYKGWRSLLLFSAAGVWMALFAGYTQAASPASEAGRLSLQAGALFATLALWLVPVVREVLRGRRPERWPVPEPGKLISSFDGVERFLHPGFPAHLLSGLVPLVGVAFTQEIWGLSKEPLGWVALGGAVSYAAAAETLRRIEDEGRLYYTNALAALLLFTLGIVLALEGNALFFTLAMEATVLHLVSRRLSDKIVSALAHALFSAVGIWLSWRILSGVGEAFVFGPTELAFLNVEALLDLSVVAMAFGLSAIFAYRSVVRIYRVAAHAALLGLLFQELIVLPGGDTAVFVSWAAYASGLHLLSRRYPQWGTAVGSHVLWVVVGLWLAGRLAWSMGLEQEYVYTSPSVADLAVICLALLTSVLLSPGRSVVTYRVVAHVTVLAWLWRELGAFPDGAAYVTVAWGFYAAGLLVFGLRRSSVGLVRVGVVTLFLVVGKLFLVDLVWVGAIWRILLFLGFGVAFLALSYYLQDLWRQGVRGRSEKG